MLAVALPAGAWLSSAPAYGESAGLSAGICPGSSFNYLSDAQLVQSLHTMVVNGARWIRVDVDWPAVEGSPGSLNWSIPDRVIRAARSYGLKVDALLAYTPGWAALADGSPNPSDFAAFAQAAARHYAPMGVSAYEIWNEPNLNQTWGSVVSPAEYVQLLKDSYPAVKAVDPSATVLTAGLAPAADASDGSSMEPLTFLSGVYADGGRGYFDAVGIHPYSYPDMPMQPDSWNPFYHLPSIHTLMGDYGDGAKKVWITEYGAPTSGGQAVTESQQAQMASQAFSQADQWPWVGALFWFDWQDNSSDGPYGLLRSDGSPKPALSVYASAAKALSPPPASPVPIVVAPTTAPPHHSSPATPPAVTLDPSAPSGGSGFPGGSGQPLAPAASVVSGPGGPSTPSAATASAGRGAAAVAGVGPSSLEALWLSSAGRPYWNSCPGALVGTYHGKVIPFGMT